MIFGHFLKPKKKKSRQKRKSSNENIINDKIIRDIRTLFEQEENQYETKRVSNFWNNNYIEYESNGYKKRLIT